MKFQNPTQFGQVIHLGDWLKERKSFKKIKDASVEDGFKAVTSAILLMGVISIGIFLKNYSSEK